MAAPHVVPHVAHGPMSSGRDVSILVDEIIRVNLYRPVVFAYETVHDNLVDELVDERFMDLAADF